MKIMLLLNSIENTEHMLKRRNFATFINHTKLAQTKNVRVIKSTNVAKLSQLYNVASLYKTTAHMLSSASVSYPRI